MRQFQRYIEISVIQDSMENFLNHHWVTKFWLRIAVRWNLIQPFIPTKVSGKKETQVARPPIYNRGRSQAKK